MVPPEQSVAYTQSDLDRIRAARLRGVRTVTYTDRQVTYTSDAEMRQVEQDIVTALSATGRTRSKQWQGASSKGLS